MYEFIIEVAGVRVLMKCRYEKTMQYMSDYIVSGESFDIVSSVSDDELASMINEVGASERNHYLVEITALYRPIAEAIPMRDCFVFHGAAIGYRDKAILFTAPSGTGKTTHISLWKKHLGEDVVIINGDKPIITAKNDKTTVHGTPWSGKERWQNNISSELSAICLVMRGTENKIERVESGEILQELIYQTYVPKDSLSLVRTLELLDAVLSKVPVYRLYCDISKEAVKCSFECLTGLDFEKERIKENNFYED